jgi:hypothetical protein
MKTKNTKRKVKQDEYTDTGCFTAAPPWVTAKTKERSYAVGYSDGKQQGYRDAHAGLKEELDRQKKSDRQIQLDAIKAMGQSLECMAKALMSINNQL